MCKHGCASTFTPAPGHSGQFFKKMRNLIYFPLPSQLLAIQQVFVIYEWCDKMLKSNFLWFYLLDNFYIFAFLGQYDHCAGHGPFFWESKWSLRFYGSINTRNAYVRALEQFLLSSLTVCVHLRSSLLSGCIFCRAFGCCTPQTLVKIVIFSVFVLKSWKNTKSSKFGAKFSKKIVLFF